MEWQTQWGPQIPSLLEIRETTDITPKALENRPVLDDRLSFFYGLFSELNEDRDYAASGAPLPLKLKDFATYCEFWQTPQEERAWLWGVVKIFDKAWLKIQSEREKARLEKATKV